MSRYVANLSLGARRGSASSHLFTCSTAHLLYFSPSGRKIGAEGFEPSTS